MYMKIRYPLFWLSVIVSFAAVVFCSVMLTKTILSVGLLNPVAFIQSLCVAVNAWILSKAPSRWHHMKKLDVMIEELEKLRAEIEANRLIREGKMISITLNREPRSPAEVFRDPPKFSSDNESPR